MSYEEQLNPDSGLPPAFMLQSDGDYIVGVVHGFETGYDTKWRDDIYPIIILRAEEWKQGESPDQLPFDVGDYVSVHVFSDVLKRAIARLNPTQGEKVGIVRLPARKSKSSGRMYTDYRVKVFGRAESDSFMGSLRRARDSESIQDPRQREMFDDSRASDRPPSRHSEFDDREDARDSELPF